MKANEFGHLHNHTDLSFLDGFCRIDELFDRAVELGYKFLAVTEHGNMCSAVKFQKSALEHGVKPIIGQEFYIVDRLWTGARETDSHWQVIKTAKKEATRHIVLLAKDGKGYQNLIALSTIANTKGFYYNPRISLDLLREHSEGLICLTACLNGVIARSIRAGKKDEAISIASELKSIFGADLYIEVQTNPQPLQLEVNKELFSIAGALGIKPVATTDVHYIRKEDYDSHDAWLCIRFNNNVSDLNRQRYEPNAYYLLGPDEIPQELHEAAKNTVEVANKCNVHIELVSGAANFPKSGIKDPISQIRIRCLEALDNMSVFMVKDFHEYNVRFERELGVIKQLGFGDYFIIIADIIDWCKTQGIRTGPARGSGAGSLICYLLGITEIDPIKFDLIFERFLHEDRISPPDLDLDFQQDRRDEVIEHVKQRYGEENVASIGSLTVLQPKQAIKDAMRILGIEYKVAETISKMIPETAKTLDDAVVINKELHSKIKGNPLLTQAFTLAKKFQGHIRQAGTHPAGVVISPIPLNQIVPLQRIRGKISTQYDMHDIEDLGLLKIDFLGLRTLTIIDNAIRALNYDGHLNGEPNWDDLDDAGVYNMLRRGETKGCFMLETPLLTRASVEFGVDKFQDIILIGAICRPVTLETGMKTQCLVNRHDPSKIKYGDERLRPIFEETHGVVVYQEQIMQICRDLANFTWTESDKVRKLIGKGAQMSAKDKKQFLAEAHDKFFSGCLENKVPKKVANEMWGLVQGASYGFNKAHATSYAMLSYRTAWLKHHYPAYFMAAVISSVADRQERVADYVRECRRMSVEILLPDIAKSSATFVVEAGKIRFGLSAIKGIGLDTAIKIEAAVHDLPDGASLAELATVCSELGKKSILEALVEAGALDNYIPTRRSVIENLDTVAKKIRVLSKPAINVGQGALFDMGVGEISLDKSMQEYSTKHLAKMEYNRTGMFLSTDPLKRHRKFFLEYCIASEKEVETAKELGGGKFGGVVVEINAFTTKKHDLMAKVMIETIQGVFNFVFFSTFWDKYGWIFEIGKPVIIKADYQEGGDWIARFARLVEE